MKFCNLRPDERNLWLIRIYYFLALGGIGLISLYLNLFFVSRGLSGFQVGIVLSIGFVVALSAAPIWAQQGEKRGKQRVILQISLLFSAIGYLWPGFQDLLIWILVVNSFRTLASAGISPLSNLLAISVTGATRSGFGSVRVWASIGWTAVVFLGGWQIGAVGFKADFIGTFVVKILAIITLLWVITEGKIEKQPEESVSENLKHIISGLLRRPVMVAVASLIFLCGFFNSGVEQFEIVYLSQLGASELLLGVAGMLGSGLEIPAMFWADRILKRRDPYNLLIVTMLIYVALRGFVFAFPSVVTVMLERVLNGISFSFYVVTRVRFISENTVPSQTGTVLALFTTSLIYFLQHFRHVGCRICVRHFGSPLVVYHRCFRIFSEFCYFINWTPQKCQCLSLSIRTAFSMVTFMEIIAQAAT